MVSTLNMVLRGAVPVILVLVLIAFVLSIGSQVVDTTKALYDTDDAVVSITNESLTVAFNTIQTLANERVDNTSLVVSNATGNYAQALFEMSAAQGVVGQINISTDINDGEEVNVTYDFTSTNKNAAFNASVDGLSGLTTFSDFQPTFAIIVVAILVIAVLIFGLVFVGMRVI